MKKMILFFLLLTTTITKSTLDIDLHIKNLNDAHLKKLQELSEISKQIAEKQALLKYWVQQGVELIGSPREFSPELRESFNDFILKFEKAFCEKKNVKEILADGFSSPDNYEFNFVKVLMVRYYFETLLIANLIERYEKCLQEFIEISDN